MRINAKCRISTCLFSLSVKFKSFLFKIAVWSDLPSSGVAVLLDYVYLGRARLSLENGLSALEVSRRLHMKGQDLTSDLTHWLMKNVHFWSFALIWKCCAQKMILWKLFLFNFLTKMTSIHFNFWMKSSGPAIVYF